MKAIYTFISIGLVTALLAGCSSSRQFTLAPIKTFDPDNRNIPEPKEKEENQIWDIVDYTFVYQIEKILDLNWSARKVGKMAKIAKGRPADNVNALDEAPNSSWYTNRHFHHRLALDELRRGPNVTTGPDQSAPWTITRGKFEGGTPGFTIKDLKGDAYILKFDAPRFYEMGSSAEVISTKIFHACGYNVPQNTIEYFDLDSLTIGATAQVVEGGFKRQMTRDDLEEMLKDIPRRADGKIRCLASKYVDGKPVGVWNFRGTRGNDPNDLVHHEHRRELRGLRTISSWLSDEDRRAANTLAVYTEDRHTGNKYIKHYLLDMGSTLGSNNIVPHKPKYGNEYLIDLRSIAKQYAALGFSVKPWEFDTRDLDPEFLSVGYYESKIFNPGAWFPTYPNPAFEKATLRDAFWGAKIVMAFRDEDIRAIVETAKISDLAAREYLIKTLIERRNKIGRYWFARMNPIDHFRLEQEGGALVLKFKDLAVDGKLASLKETAYRYVLSHRKKDVIQEGSTNKPEIVISQNGSGFFDAFLPSTKIHKKDDFVFRIQIRTQRKESALSKAVDVYVYYAGKEVEPRVVGIVREE